MIIVFGWRLVSFFFCLLPLISFYVSECYQYGFFVCLSLFRYGEGGCTTGRHVYESFFGNTNLTIFIFLYEKIIVRSFDLDLKLENV